MRPHAPAQVPHYLQTACRKSKPAQALSRIDAKKVTLPRRLEHLRQAAAFYRPFTPKICRKCIAAMRYCLCSLSNGSPIFQSSKRRTPPPSVALRGSAILLLLPIADQVQELDAPPPASSSFAFWAFAIPTSHSSAVRHIWRTKVRWCALNLLHNSLNRFRLEELCSNFGFAFHFQTIT
ncbi:hypothetical protein QO005_001859 [Rhizobium paknamense]|uniref:Uncharacterized protein n=1 Tax=Rhizobium paknamense TaxID=1206817 RepID=A0ABU0IDL5_9HYPH|nr:hypothetical protein [Rhizobium paknamense]